MRERWCAFKKLTFACIFNDPIYTKKDGLVLINLVPEQRMHSPSSLMERDGAEKEESQLVFEKLSSLTGVLGT